METGKQRGKESTAVSEEAIRRLNTGELVRRLVNNLSHLVDREVDLAKREALSDVIHVGAGAVLLGFALLLLYTFIAALIVAAIYAVASLAPPMSSVIASLVIAGVFLVLGLIFAAVGWFVLRIRPLERTQETVREDVEWVRDRIR